jgi:phi13 family phage major tail protein
MAQEIVKGEDVQYPIGISDLFICMIKTKGSSSIPPVYDTKIWRQPVISKLKVKGNGKTVEKWASNKLFIRVNRQTQHELSLDYVGLPVALLDQMRGNKVVNGVGFGTGDPIAAPEFAVGYIAPNSDGVDTAYWYPRASLDAAVETDYETAKEDLEINDVSVTIQASTLQNNNLLWTDLNTARAMDKALTAEQFMSAVIADESDLQKLIAGLAPETPPTTPVEGGGK